MFCFVLFRGKKRGGGGQKSGLNGPRTRSNLGSREDLDSSTSSFTNPTSSSSKSNSNFNTRTRQPSKAQAMLARMQDKPPGTML